jgi:hypothetical protein
MMHAVHEFLKNEDGFFGLLGGLIGGALGLGATGTGLLSAGASLLGNNYLSRKAAGRDYQMRANLSKAELRDYYKTLSEEAVKGGFHPLEALRATGGPGGAAPFDTGGGIMSMTARQNAFDTVEEVLTGQAAEVARDEKLKNQVERIAADESRTGEIRQDYGKNADDYADWQGPLQPWNQNYGRMVLNGREVPVPQTLMDYFEVPQGAPMTMDFIEQIVGDEAGQVAFLDWVGEIGFAVKAPDVKQPGFAREIWNAFKNDMSKLFKPVEEEKAPVPAPAPPKFMSPSVSSQETYRSPTYAGPQPFVSY